MLTYNKHQYIINNHVQEQQVIEMDLLKGVLLVRVIILPLPLVIAGSLWLYLIIFGYPWLSLVIPGYPWLSLVIPGYPLLSLVIPGYSWLSLVFLGYFWFLCFHIFIYLPRHLQKSSAVM